MNAEQQVAATIVAWLTAEGWDVYQEVLVPGGSRADIVAVCGLLRWAIEVKTSLSLTVLDQAWQNTQYFHLSSYAVPAPTRLPHSSTRSWRFAQDMAKRLGFGALRVLPERPRHSPILEDVTPRLNRRPGRVELHEGQKTAVQAGAAGGGYWTHFMDTAQQLSKQVQWKPGIELRDAVKLITHHYASNPGACRRLSEMIQRGVIKDVRLEHSKLYPVVVLT